MSSAIRILLATICVAQAAAALHQALAEDLFAFPKYRVTFLNHLPVLNETAERWLDVGLQGGELEFLDQPWQDIRRYQDQRAPQIASGDPTEVGASFC